jgi:hypothetical protein
VRRSYDELVADNAEIKRALVNGLMERLRAIPGVHHVTNGLKVRSGRLTDELGICVFVRDKRPEQDIPPAERIPRQIDGILTDVDVLRPGQFLSNNTRYRNVKGGIQISNNIVSVLKQGKPPTIGVGTFGCTATLTSDKTTVLLTCGHVLLAHGGASGNWVYQPAAQSFYIDPADTPAYLGDGHTRIARIVHAEMTDKVDAAVARLDLSSCCRCCGLDYDNEIVGLSDNQTPPTPPSNKIVGTRAAVPGTTVFKVGQETLRTVGFVRLDNAPDFPLDFLGGHYNFVGQIQIMSDDPTKPFAEEGDSGSVIVDEAGYVVGLLFGKNILSEECHANHIDDVTTAMGITLNTATTEHTAGARVTVPRPTYEAPPTMSGAELYAESRARLLADPAGEWLWELGDKHREEIVTLVTNHRRVKVAWHRAQGPALFAAALNTLRSGGNALPVPTGDTTLEASLARVGDALAAHGSPELREAIATHREMLLASVRDSATADEVLARLSAVLFSRA